MLDNHEEIHLHLWVATSFAASKVVVNKPDFKFTFIEELQTNAQVSMLLKKCEEHKIEVSK